jgi:chromosome segregation ATPase
MAADVAKLTTALDKVFKTFSSGDVQSDSKTMKVLSERGIVQSIEQKYQQQLQRARAAFLQEFRNHAVVVEHEVRKIRDELAAKMEQKYGEKIAALHDQLAQSESLVQTRGTEIAHLKNLTSVQESYVAAAKHRWETAENYQEEVQRLKEELLAAKSEIQDLKHQLMCRDELVTQLGGELSGLEADVKRQAGLYAEEKHEFEECIRGLRQEMQVQQKEFKEHLAEYQEHFTKYRSKTSSELQIRDILIARLSEALSQMDEERKLHIKARTKPSRRIGESQSGELSADAIDEEQFESYELPRDTKYRVDDMGMDTSWRDYQMGLQFGPQRRKVPQTKFQVERVRRVVPLPGASQAATADTPRTARQMFQVPASVGTVLSANTH